MTTKFNLNDFMAGYRDFARAYLFLVEIHNFNDKNNDHSFLVKTTRLPDFTINEIQSDIQGNIYKIASTKVIADWSVEFNMDDKNLLRSKFIKWSQLITNPTSKKDHGSPVDVSNGGYFRDITIKHLNGQGNSTMEYKLLGAWPKTVGEVSLDYSNKAIATFEVTFSYQSYEVKYNNQFNNEVVYNDNKFNNIEGANYNYSNVS